MNNCQIKSRRCENGFSYIDVMVAIVILMIGVIALAGTLTANLVRSFETEKQIVAKQVAVSTIESIISARDINRNDGNTGWETVANVNPGDPTARGIFLNGWTPIREDLGLDGVAGTADDACPSNAFCDVNGYQNTSAEIPGFQRQIVITDVNDPERPTPPNRIRRKTLAITIRYYVNQVSRQQTVSTMLSDY